ncbi:uncharacterized protein M437DRAFT_64344 [Aureobasidium melanogenum CBS 110374]|uniref:Uncharacterized protein n=1 Tax=Aureobasidium melanogenum (strain CBS 110374) TaxID=1043003 RepID=A0A074VVC1_AURM1|nr:uncharacterized protein M437DRAFT_64344 [Aureobasidium melanogenum CBS 110374]KEQ64715.1 hypothetical protein M437DRAFT_64344 [Aureobasidium melanogenum CBS 110374]
MPVPDLGARLMKPDQTIRMTLESYSPVWSHENIPQDGLTDSGRLVAEPSLRYLVPFLVFFSLPTSHARRIQRSNFVSLLRDQSAFAQAACSLYLRPFFLEGGDCQNSVNLGNEEPFSSIVFEPMGLENCKSSRRR